MQQMKSLDVDSRRLLSFISDTVERFQRETGISARFFSELAELDMPQQVCRELARIVQEALVNVRKHSHAKQVLVRLNANNGALAADDRRRRSRLPIFRTSFPGRTGNSARGRSSSRNGFV